LYEFIAEGYSILNRPLNLKIDYDIKFQYYLFKEHNRPLRQNI